MNASPQAQGPGQASANLNDREPSSDRANTVEPADTGGPHTVQPHDKLQPLPGEAGIPSVAAHRGSGNRHTQLLALSALTLAVAGGAVWAYQHFNQATSKPKAKQAQAQDKPAAASGSPRRLDMPSLAPIGGAAPATAASGATATQSAGANSRDPADPLGLHRQNLAAQTAMPASAQGVPGAGAGQAMNGAAAPPPRPEDAPVLLVSTRPNWGTLSGHPNGRTPPGAPQMTPTGWNPSAAPGNDPLASTARNLQDYEAQLQGLLETLTKTANLATGQTPEPPSGGHPFGPPIGMSPQGVPSAGAPSGGLFGGQLQASHTPRVSAGNLGNRSLLLPKGTAFTCALKTRVISATSGLVGCQVQRHVYSDDGRVLLIERGSHLDGEYRVTQVRQGMVRIPVLWTRVRTPHGITVDLESPATGALGESGIDGHVDNRWPERIGAAMLLSLIDDSVKLVIQSQTNDRSGDTIVLPSSTANASRLAEKVLDSTINIPPMISTPQGSIVGIYVARDVDFSGVYELRPSAPR